MLVQVINDQRFIDEANIFGEHLIAWILIQPNVEEEMKKLVVKTLLDKDVKEATIQILAYIVDQPNSKEIFSNYLNDVFLRKDVLDNLSKLFVEGAAVTLMNP